MPDEPEGLDPERIIFERRKFVRVKGTFVVSYTDVTTQQPKSDVTQTKNMGVGGLLFTTDRKFPRGTVLKVKLRLPDTPDYINVKVRVLDSKQLVKGILYDTRVKFLGIREEDKHSIRKIVEYSIRKQKEG